LLSQQIEGKEKKYYFRFYGKDAEIESAKVFQHLNDQNQNDQILV
jgi:hypothetical protein